MMTLRIGVHRVRRNSASRGFTLIELILVMSVLVTVLSVAGPSLSRFFKGRSMDSEARRFVTLTRHAQSRAISEGAPVKLWIDVENAAYGLELDESYADEDTRALEFDLGKDLELEVHQPAVLVRTKMLMARENPDLISIKFKPDGGIEETSPEFLIFRQMVNGVKDAEIVIAQSRNRLYYEIATNAQAYLKR